MGAMGYYYYYMKRLHICTNCYKQTCSKAVTPRGWKPRLTIKDGATAAETQTKQETLHQLETETRTVPRTTYLIKEGV